MFLNNPCEGAGPHLIVIALVAQPSGGRPAEFDGDIAIHELGFKLQDKLFNHLQDHRFRQRCKRNYGVKTVAEFWCKGPFNRGSILAFAAVAQRDSMLGLEQVDLTGGAAVSAPS